MKSAVRFLLAMFVVGSALNLTGCGDPPPPTMVCHTDGSCTITLTWVQPKGIFVVKQADATQTAAATETVDPSQLALDLNGTTFATSSSGSATVTLYDSSENIIVAQSFPWIKSGLSLVFQNPAAITAWASAYPTAANVGVSVTPGSPPVDGTSHTLASAIVYQGTTLSSASITVPAECESKVHTVEPCAQ